MVPDDEALLRRCADGDRQASALLINRYSARILSLAQRMTGSREDAEDITQEVFIKIFRQAAKWESGKAKLSTWIHKVTVNQCYDRLRKKRETGVDEVPEMVDDTAGDTFSVLPVTTRPVLQSSYRRGRPPNASNLPLTSYRNGNAPPFCSVIMKGIQISKPQKFSMFQLKP